MEVPMAADSHLMRAAVGLLVAFVAVIAWQAHPAGADCGSSEPAVSAQAATEVGSLLASAEQEVGASSCQGGVAQESGAMPVRDSGLDAVCVRESIGRDVDPFAFCDLPEDGTTADMIPGLVAAAFRRIPLPEAPLVIQPPNGRTLVNFETNFYTEQGELNRAVTLLGRQVELRIWPASFRWQFGDGESTQTTEPGAAYPDLQITHAYLRRGRVAPSVDTTYAAQFRVDGGPWRDVAGTVTIQGSPQGLRVVEARPVLVGG